MPGNIHPGLRHDLHRMRVHPMLLNPGRVGLDQVTLQRPSPPLGHLAPARVPGAEEQHPHFAHIRLHCSLTSIASTFFNRLPSSAMRSCPSSDRRTHATASRAAVGAPLPGSE